MVIIIVFFLCIAFAFMVIVAIVRIAEGNYSKPPLADFKHLPSLFGISVYSFMCQHSLPGMVTPMRGKKWVYWMLAGDFATTLVFYLLLTITGSFAFEASKMRELYTLDFFNPGGKIILLIIGTYLAMFPVFTLSTNFPIIAVTLRENLKSLAGLSMKLLKIERNFPKIIDLFFFPTIALIPPLVISYVTQQEDLLVSVTGSFPGVAVQYVIPAALVLMGRYTLKKKYGSYKNTYKSPVSHFIIVGIVIAWSFISVVLIIVNMSLKPPEVTSHPIG